MKAAAGKILFSTNPGHPPNSFSSGMFIFGGGDSEKENRRLLEELQKRLNPVT